MVSLGAYEVDRARLEEGVPNTVTAGIRDAFEEFLDYEDEIAPRWGRTVLWRVVLQEQDRVVLAGPVSDEEWVTAEFGRGGDRWRYRRHGTARLGPTRAERGRGLRLVWASSVFTVEVGQRPELRIRLRNERDEEWEDDGGEYWVIAQLLDAATRAPIFENARVAIGAVGRSYRLRPGEEAMLPVAVCGEAERLGVGEYLIRAQVRGLGLVSNTARLVIV